MTLSGTCGVLNDALSIYFGDPALASRASPDGALETRLRRPAPEGGGHYFGLINGLPPGVPGGGFTGIFAPASLFAIDSLLEGKGFDMSGSCATTCSPSRRRQLRPLNVIDLRGELVFGCTPVIHDEGACCHHLGDGHPARA